MIHYQKDAERLANSVDPDQTAPLYTDCSDLILSATNLRIFSIYDIEISLLCFLTTCLVYF